MHTVSQTLRILPIHVVDPRMDKETSVLMGEELESLIATLGGVIVDRVMQRMDRPDMRTFIGKGKVQEVLEIIQEKKVDVVVLNADAKSKQVFNLKHEFQKANPSIEVWDRVDLILQIFDKHAKTTEAKLQIELARMRYMGPRIYGMGKTMSQQGGGIGVTGIGETNTELMRRHWRDAMKKVNETLLKIQKTHLSQLEKRKRAGLQTVSIVGYTNAGKSSLFNVLTGKNTLVENELFATLDSTVGKVYLERLGKEVLVTDTIGFIRDLPPKLIDAFKSTLMESMHADILLHVVDSADVEASSKIQIVDEILISLGRSPSDIFYVFNKSDLVDTSALLRRFERLSPIFVSAKTGTGIEDIKEMISERLASTV